MLCRLQPRRAAERAHADAAWQVSAQGCLQRHRGGRGAAGQRPGRRRRQPLQGVLPDLAVVRREPALRQPGGPHPHQEVGDKCGYSSPERLWELRVSTEPGNHGSHGNVMDFFGWTGNHKSVMEYFFSVMENLCFGHKARSLRQIVNFKNGIECFFLEFPSAMPLLSWRNVIELGGKIDLKIVEMSWNFFFADQ